MGFIDNASVKLSDSINKIIDKSRQLAQLNRLSAVIKSETEVLNRAYIALGKQYYKNLNGDTETPDMSHICEVIEESKARLKKAQAGYEYIKQNGVAEPKPKQPVIKISADEAIQPDIEQLEEDDDITIAYANVSGESADETAEEPKPSDSVQAADEPKPEEKTVEEVKAETTVKSDISEKTEIPEKKTLYSKKETVEPSDAEAANDSDAMPIA
ncbi:MAG: hypothetical protein PUG48_09410 [Clostridia bacterium]|nr:hypothetical protein [Clostridia bacterium]